MTDLISREAAIAVLMAEPSLKEGSASYVAAALIRALPAAPARTGVTVKPLVWERPAWGSEYAQTPWGRYAVGPLLDAWAWCWNGETFTADTELDAKAAAQADYTARILAALE